MYRISTCSCITCRHVSEHSVYAPVDRANMSGRAKDPLDHAEMSGLSISFRRPCRQIWEKHVFLQTMQTCLRKHMLSLTMQTCLESTGAAHLLVDHAEMSTRPCEMTVCNTCSIIPCRQMIFFTQKRPVDFASWPSFLFYFLIHGSTQK